MSSRSDQYADEAHRDAGDPTEYADRPYTDRPPGDDPSAGTEGRRRFPYLSSWGGAWGVLPWASSERAEGDYVNDPAGATEYRPAEEAGGGGIASYWDEGLITLLIVGGAILFVFPEPVTSGVGVLLVAVGVLAWLVDWAT